VGSALDAADDGAPRAPGAPALPRHGRGGSESAISAAAKADRPTLAPLQAAPQRRSFAAALSTDSYGQLLSGPRAARADSLAGQPLAGDALAQGGQAADAADACGRLLSDLDRLDGYFRRLSKAPVAPSSSTVDARAAPPATPAGPPPVSDAACSPAASGCSSASTEHSARENQPANAQVRPRAPGCMHAGLAAISLFDRGCSTCVGLSRWSAAACCLLFC
jgi:hypothetical protein